MLHLHSRSPCRHETILGRLSRTVKTPLDSDRVWKLSYVAMRYRGRLAYLATPKHYIEGILSSVISDFLKRVPFFKYSSTFATRFEGGIMSPTESDIYWYDKPPSWCMNQSRWSSREEGRQITEASTIIGTSAMARKVKESIINSLEGDRRGRRAETELERVTPKSWIRWKAQLKHSMRKGSEWRYVQRQCWSSLEPRLLCASLALIGTRRKRKRTRWWSF